MTNCPRCNRPLDRHHLRIQGMTVLACRRECQLYAVTPPDGIAWEWLAGGAGLLLRLEESHRRALAAKQIRDSAADDPRWDAMEVTG
jgi:hypothetical protein